MGGADHTPGHTHQDQCSGGTLSGTGSQGQNTETHCCEVCGEEFPLCLPQVEAVYLLTHGEASLVAFSQLMEKVSLNTITH